MRDVGRSFPAMFEPRLVVSRGGGELELGMLKLF